MTLYDTIGKNYTVTRKPDHRITKAIIDYLDLSAPATIADVGAGTGNYSLELAKKGFRVLAIEPSEVMRRHAKRHKNIKYIKGVAEDLPLGAKSVDGIICLAAIHFFYDLNRVFKEMKRVLKKKGKIVIFMVDPSLRSQDCWLDHYFAPYNQSEYNFPPIKKVTSVLSQIFQSPVKIVPFLLPDDLEDHFFLSGWRRPHLYLSDKFCEGISSLAVIPKNRLHQIQNKLKRDLKSGKFEKKYGYLKKLDKYEGGYRFLVIQNL